MSDNQTKPSAENNNKTAGSIFRQKSIERVSSPEELNDYIRVVTPSIWIVIIAAAAMLAGVIIWGVFGSGKAASSAAGPAGQGIYAVSPIDGEDPDASYLHAVSENAKEARPF